jgi:hypothetical protein
MRNVSFLLVTTAVACSGAPGSGFRDDTNNGGGTSSGAASSGTASGSPGGTSTSSGGGTTSGGGSSSGSFGGDGGLSGGSSGGGTSGCSGQAANFVYVLSAQNDLYSFAPGKKVFTKIGQLGCQTSMLPNSMAVDRDAVAWVNYVQSDPMSGADTAGVIYQVSTHDASCQPQPTVNLPNGWYRVGMGYSTNGAAGMNGTTSETLYVAGTGNTNGATGKGLGFIDLTADTAKNIGMFSGALAGQNAELTGTGDGRLYGFFTTMPVQVAAIDKTSGATQTPVAMSGVQTPNDWAFSFWGGHFYLYTSQGVPSPIGHGSDVTDYDPVSGSINTAYMTGIGFDIVGAGVSTCAPVTPPQ